MRAFPLPVAEEEFTRTIRDAELRLSEAEASLPRHDEFRVILAAYRAVLEVFPHLVRRIEKTAENTPLSAEQVAALSATVSTAAAGGAASGTRRAVERLARSLNHRTAVGVGLTLGLVGIGCGAAGYEQGRVSAHAEVIVTQRALRLDLDDAALWVALIRANPNLAKSMAVAQRWTDASSGRPAAAISLFLEPDNSLPTRR